MKNKIAVGFLLLALCAAWSAHAEDAAPAGKATKIVAYYFHGTARCPTCIKLESYTHETIKDSFKDELKDGRIEWRVVNTDEDKNGHFVKDFSLDGKSVVLVAMQGDRQLSWRNLDKIWDLVGSKDEFKKYIRTEVSGFIKKD
jgi:hypothetical protein